MALPKKGFRKISVNGEQFLWKIRKKISWEEIHDGQLKIPIQHVSGGQLLYLTIGYSRSYFAEINEFNITPSMIELCIKKAILDGWNFNSKGKVFELNCTELLKSNKSNKKLNN